MREKNWLPAGSDELPSLRTRQSFPIVYPKKKWGKPEISAGKEILRFLPIQFFNTPWPMITRLSRRPRVVDLSLSQDLFCREKSHRKWKQFVISLSSDNFAVSRQPHRFHLCDVEKKDFLKVAKHRKRRERKKSIIFTSTYIGKKLWLERFALHWKSSTNSFAVHLCWWREVKAWKLPINRSKGLFRFLFSGEKLFRGKNRNQLVGRKSIAVETATESTFAVWTSVPCGMCRS